MILKFNIFSSNEWPYKTQMNCSFNSQVINHTYKFSFKKSKQTSLLIMKSRTKNVNWIGSTVRVVAW